MDMLRQCVLGVMILVLSASQGMSRDIVDREVQEWLINEPSTSISSHIDGIQQVFHLQVRSSSTAWIILPRETCGDKIASEVTWCYMQRWENRGDVQVSIVTVASDDINLLMRASIDNSLRDVQKWLVEHCGSFCVQLQVGDAYSIYDLSALTPTATAEAYAFFLHTKNGWELLSSRHISFWYPSMF
jgi:hypothetical protein